MNCNRAYVKEWFRPLRLVLEKSGEGGRCEARVSSTPSQALDYFLMLLSSSPDQRNCDCLQFDAEAAIARRRELDDRQRNEWARQANYFTDTSVHAAKNEVGV